MWRAYLKQFQKVIELAVNVTAYCHRRLNRLHIALFDEKILHLEGPRMVSSNHDFESSILPTTSPGTHDIDGDSGH